MYGAIQTWFACGHVICIYFLNLSFNQYKLFFWSFLFYCARIIIVCNLLRNWQKQKYWVIVMLEYIYAL